MCVEVGREDGKGHGMAIPTTPVITPPLLAPQVLPGNQTTTITTLLPPNPAQSKLKTTNNLSNKSSQFLWRKFKVVAALSEGGERQPGLTVCFTIVFV